MAANENDNIDKGNKHGQDSFESAGVYLPKETHEKPQRIARARKPVESYDLQAAFDEIDDLKEQILDSEKPAFAVIMQGIAKKMEAVGLVGSKKTELNNDLKENQSLILEIIGVKSSNSNT